LTKNSQNSRTNIDRLAIVGLFAVTIGWGASFFMAKGAIAEMGVWPYLAWRSALTPFIFAAFFPRVIFSATWALIFKGFLLGAALFIALWSQSIGLQYTTSGRSGFITSLYVPFTPFFACLLLRQTLLLRQLLVALLAVLGLYLLTQKGSLVWGLMSWFETMNRGDLWTLLTAVSYGMQIVLAERFTREEPDSIALSFWQFVGCSLSVIPFIGIQALFAGGVLGMEAGPLHGKWNPGEWSGASIWAVAFNIVVVTCFGFTMQIVCQKIIGALKAALIFALEAPFAVAFGYFFLGEIMTPAEACGAALVFLTSIIPERWLKRS
jgi:drug/metabolite transporter (DMT)-like permease